MSAPPPAWVAAARAEAARGPAGPRQALLLGGHAVGSVHEHLFAGAALAALQAHLAQDGRCRLAPAQHAGRPAWRVDGPQGASAALDGLARALRAAGCCGPWRDEQLAVCAPGGERIATVERGAVRVLGLPTQAVHLVGCAADGRGLWLQQRSLSKPTHPGAWDTLMGGMVSAADTLDTALARETWEEAGLHLAQLAELRRGAPLALSRPSDEGGPGRGWMREQITWASATLPDGLVPSNQDGEVERFECLGHQAVQARLAAGAFTPEAALVLAAFYGW